MLFLFLMGLVAVAVCVSAQTVTMTQYSDASCTQIISAIQAKWVSNPFVEQVGVCKNIVDMFGIQVGIEVVECSGTYVKENLYKKGCGTPVSGPPTESNEVGKCVGEDGIYYRITC